MYAIKKIFSIVVAVVCLIAAIAGTYQLFAMDTNDPSNIVYGIANVVLALCAAPTVVGLVKIIFNHG